MLTVFILTSKCNLNCDFCICNQEKELTTKFVKEKLNKCSGTIIFTGGEPLLRKDINDLCSYAKKKKLKVGIHTNGLLFNELKLKNVDFVNLPLDGPEQIHNKLRKNNYSSVIKSLNKLKENQIKIRISTIATKINLKQIKEIPYFLKDFEISLWRIFKYKGDNREYQISDLDFDKLKKIKTEFPLEFIKNIDDFGYWEKIDKTLDKSKR